MKILVAMSACAVLLAGSGAWAASPSPIDRQFAAKASVGNTFEVKSSRLALQRSTDPEVRAMARWMIDDHTKAQRLLDGAAAKSGTESGLALDDDHEGKLAALGGLSGPAFDQAYVTDQVEAHRETAKALTDFEAMGYDPALMRWASATLTAVNLHLLHFEELSGASK